MRLEFHDEDSVISYLMSLPHFEFERAVRHGHVAFVTRVFGFRRGYFTREVRRMRRNLDTLDRGIQEGYAEYLKTGFYGVSTEGRS
mgnify:CR=1 FL=1